MEREAGEQERSRKEGRGEKQTERQFSEANSDLDTQGEMRDWEMEEGG